MSLQRKPKDIQVRLPVCIQPGRTIIEVTLFPDTTAGDIVEKCCSSSELNDRPQSPTFTQSEWCVLVADFQGYEKRFTPDERLYQLVRKHILLAGNTEGVRFYLRKKKKRFSISSFIGDAQTEPATNKVTLPPTHAINQTCHDLDVSSISCESGEKFMQFNKVPNTAIYDSLQRSLLKKRAVMQQQARTRATVLPQPPPNMAHERGSSCVTPNPQYTYNLPNSKSMNNMNQNELLQISEKQRRALAQQREQQIQKLRYGPGQSGTNSQNEMIHRLQGLRAELRREDTEMQRLNSVKRKADIQRETNTQAEIELQKLQKLFTSKEKELRCAVNKVDTLRKQLEMLQERRKSAAQAANAMQIQITGQSNNIDETDIGKLITDNSRIDTLMSSLRVENKPSTSNERQNRPQAAIEPFHVTPPAKLLEENNKNDVSKGMAIAMGAFDDAIIQTEDINRQDKAPSPPRQYANSSFIHSAYTGRLNQSPPSSDKISISMNKRMRMPYPHAIQEDGTVQPPDIIPASEKRQFGNEGEHTMHRDPDSIHIRDNNIRAVKRRSWAQHNNIESTHDETEHIKAVLRREQEKGRSHVNLSWIFEQLPHQNIQLNHVRDGLQGDAKGEEFQIGNINNEIQIKPPPPYPFHRQEPEEAGQNEGEDSRSSHASSYSDTNSKITVIDVTNESRRPPTKGILRPPGKQRHGKNIQFDPLAILLDAALEGELELVKLSAKRISNVSQCNDEGITALHNAICAGHYEIVRFLVEANADVNAQDSDGWTPLHCAASCNNLPMVKFLVERGACVFATTVSDHETPADKCEEEEDGFEAVSQFLYSMQEKMGLMNGGRVFCAYGYEGERGDELSIKEGDELTIIKREGMKEKAWWWATAHDKQTSNSGGEGYVPRNYLSLYPRLSTQHALRMFASRQFNFEEMDEIQLEITKRNNLKNLANKIPHDGNNSI